MRLHQLLTALLLAAACLAPQYAAAENDRLARVTAMLSSGQEPVRIVCFGDSVTGVYYHTGGRRAWTDMLGIALGKIYPKARTEMINAGISGHTTGAGLARIERDVIARKPHLVAVMFGLNDICQGKPQVYRDNLKTIVGRCRESGAAVVLCTLNSVYPNQRRPMTAVAEYSQIVRDVAVDLSVPLADCFAAYEKVRSEDPTEWMLLMSEDIHPCMNGHKLYAEVVAEAISGKRVSLADVGPPADSLRFTFARLQKNQPVSLIAMPPYDRIVPDVLRKLYPKAHIDVTTWPTEGQSVAALEQWAKGIRKQKPHLVVIAVPVDAAAEPEEAFIRSYYWLLSWSIAYTRAQWDVLPILPSVTKALQPPEEHRAELARRIIAGTDVRCVGRSGADARPPDEVLLEWVTEQRRISGSSAE